jgi:hypothetical protein
LVAAIIEGTKIHFYFIATINEGHIYFKLMNSNIEGTHISLNLVAAIIRRHAFTSSSWQQSSRERRSI